MENGSLLLLIWLGWYGPNSWGYFPADTYDDDDATQLRGDELVINIVKDDDNLVHQMGAETWKMGLYSNSPG
jgi:hypothetical protein